MWFLRWYLRNNPTGIAVDACGDLAGVSVEGLPEFAVAGREFAALPPVPFSGEGWQVAEGAGSGDMVSVVAGFDDHARAQDARQVRRDATIDEVYLLVRSLAQASAAMPVPPDARQGPTGQENCHPEPNGQPRCSAREASHNHRTLT